STRTPLPPRSVGRLLVPPPRGVGGWARGQSVLRSKRTMSSGRHTPDAPPTGIALKVHDLTFAYTDLHEADGDTRDLMDDSVPQAHTTVLDGVDLDVAPGRTVAVVGPTGSGKSTLTTVLMRLVDPDSGMVSYDGIDVRDLARDQIPRHAALVPQGTFVFEDTVRDNITLGAD